MVVDRQLLTVDAEGTFITEASTLGLAPGVWPECLLVDLYVFSKKDQTIFVGNLLSVNYESIFGRKLVVFND